MSLQSRICSFRQCKIRTYLNGIVTMTHICVTQTPSWIRHPLIFRTFPPLGLYQKCFFFFKKCFWHCSLSSQKMLKISRDSLKNAFSHFLSRLKIRSNKKMIKDQDTGMGGGGMLSYFRKGEEDSAILHK